MSEDDDRPEELEDEAAPTEQATIDSASARGYRKQRETRERHDERVARFWRTALADPIGRAEIWRLLREAGTFEQRFGLGPTGFPQPEASWFSAGQQAFGMRIYLDLSKIDRAGVFLMQDEHDPYFAKPKPARKPKPTDG